MMAGCLMAWNAHPSSRAPANARKIWSRILVVSSMMLRDIVPTYDGAFGALSFSAE